MGTQIKWRIYISYQIKFNVKALNGTKRHISYGISTINQKMK